MSGSSILSSAASFARSKGDRRGAATLRVARGRIGSVVIALMVGLVGAPSIAMANAESGLPRSPSPEGASVYIITPEDGESLKSPFIVRFGLKQMGVAPAGVDKEATGHHHLVIDAEVPRSDLPIPATENYRHFGKGQTEVELDLPPGEHTLQLVLGDHLHIPHDPPIVSERIEVTVEPAAEE